MCSVRYAALTLQKRKRGTLALVMRRERPKNSNCRGEPDNGRGAFFEAGAPRPLSFLVCSVTRGAHAAGLVRRVSSYCRDFPGAAASWLFVGRIGQRCSARPEFCDDARGFVGQARPCVEVWVFVLHVSKTAWSLRRWRPFRGMKCPA